MYQGKLSPADSAPWLIVGQGIAGTVLGLQLWQKGIPFCIADAGLPFGASKAAAGIFNPITGKRRQLTWNADTIWPIQEAFYPWAEQLLGADFYFNLPNVRPLFTHEERNQAEKDARKEALGPWLKVINDVPWAPQDQVKAEFGALIVNRAGYVDVQGFCQAAKAWFKDRGLFWDEAIDQEHLLRTEFGWEVQSQPFTKIIWATGAWAKSQVQTAQLPFAPLKGEILRVRPTKVFIHAGGVLNRAAYLAPRQDGTLWAGSTYEHDFATAEPTDEAQANILERVGAFYLPELEVIEHLAGIRPSVRDRRPILGPLPEFPNQFVFNGLGTKGVSLAPWLAEVLIDHILNQAGIPAEVAPRTLGNLDSYQ